jgi:putative oxidoreductase
VNALLKQQRIMMKNQQHWAPLLLRLVTGTGFMVHGFAKLSRGPAGFEKLLAQIGVPLPHFMAWATALLEFFGGLLLLLGAFVVIISIPLVVTMLVAMFTIHIRYGFSSIKTTGLTPDGPVFGPPGYEINLLYIACLVSLIIMGAGKLSIDNWRKQRAGKQVSSLHPTG